MEYQLEQKMLNYKLIHLRHHHLDRPIRRRHRRQVPLLQHIHLLLV
jgi:hypothetical protein